MRGVSRLLCLGLLVLLPASAASSESQSKEAATADKEGRTIVSCLQDMACNEPISRKRIKSIVATSSLKARKGKYAPAKLLDGKMKTAWCEGVDGSGAGERVTMELKKQARLEKILISPMYAKSEATIRNNNRLKWATVILDGQAFKLLVLGYVDDECGGDDSCPEPASLQSWDVPEDLRKKPISKVELVITEVIKGAKFDDTCLSELGLVELEEDRPE